MAGAVPAGGASPAAARPAAGKPEGGGGAGRGETGGFAALLDGARGPGAEPGADAAAEPRAALAAASEGGREPDDGDGDDPPSAHADAVDLAGNILALIGVAFPEPASAAGSAPAPDDGAPAGAPATRPGLPLPGQPTATGTTLADVRAGDNAALAPATGPAAGADAGALPTLPDLAAAAATAPDADPGVAASLATGQSAAPARVPAPMPVALAAPMAMPADPDGGFDDGLGARIGWLAGQQLGRAEIRLNPEHLGVVDVRLDLDGDRVSVELASASQDVRHALEASLVRLREMLGQQGLELARADVGAGQQRGGGSGNQGGAPAGDAAVRDGPDQPAGDAPATAIPLHRQGLLDEYA
ncbi:flagellar hook-length control protein FliK [Lysobacter sp. GX 14042]|uniref:flagellar hook-length control protein FliK n=1 Tax=Lysobacter sp. GX 14042 TaxID=2907155 RepID=UPI001F3CE4F7|nr:flagellar hook-length control protein FliK [Lysobacter sp. GX 14042]MCE7033351.1 flagellar hook-length control protein FliK [Lysobacter sp. GX 14042]